MYSQAGWATGWKKGKFIADLWSKTRNSYPIKLLTDHKTAPSHVFVVTSLNRVFSYVPCMTTNVSSSWTVCGACCSNVSVSCSVSVLQIPYNSPMSLSRHSSVSNVWVSSLPYCQPYLRTSSSSFCVHLWFTLSSPHLNLFLFTLPCITSRERMSEVFTVQTSFILGSAPDVLC